MDERRYTKCYIAFLDMLGFKNLINQSVCEDICTIFDNIKNPLKGLNLGDKPIISKEVAAAVQIKIMSDSICFYIDATCPNALLAVITSCLMFQSNLFSLSKPILLRGAIVCGDIYAKGDITFGPGLTQAYLMEEKNANYPRIILTNEVLKHARQENEEAIVNSINQDMTFRDFDAFYSLNCIRVFLQLNRGKSVCNEFIQKINQMLNTTTDESIRKKYVYLEKVLSKHCKGWIPNA